MLHVLLAAASAASVPPSRSADGGEAEEGGNDTRKRTAAAASEEAEGRGGAEVEEEEEKVNLLLRPGRGARCFLGGALLRLYASDDRAALLMPMVTFLGMQSGFIALNFLKVG